MKPEIKQQFERLGISIEKESERIIKENLASYIENEIKKIVSKMTPPEMLEALKEMSSVEGTSEKNESTSLTEKILEHFNVNSND